LGVLQEDQDLFCFFFEQTEKPHSELVLLHCAMSSYSESNNISLLYLL